MRRIAIVGALVGVGVLVVRARGAQFHERLMARCEGMFERMPDTFPPKKAMRGIEDIQARTARILEVLEAGQEEAAGPEPRNTAGQAAHHAA